MSSITKIPFSVLDLSPVFEGETASDALKQNFEFGAERLKIWVIKDFGLPSITICPELRARRLRW